MRADIFQDKKCIHLKLDKDVHAALRAHLFKHGVSMQDTFNEFAKHLVEGKRSAETILNSLIDRKLKEEILGKKRNKRNEKFNEFDVEALYNLIDSPKERIDSDERISKEDKL